MKRRRELGPKREKNRPALIRFLIYALIAAIAGAVLAYVTDWLLGEPPKVEPEQDVPLRFRFPGMILIAAAVTVLALIFFGVRAYMMGTKKRLALQSRRMKLKRS